MTANMTQTATVQVRFFWKILEEQRLAVMAIGGCPTHPRSRDATQLDQSNSKTWGFTT